MSAHINDVLPDAQNARHHTPRNIAMIAASLQDVGAARSIVIDEDNHILAGNGTIEAAAQVGIERMQIVDADGDTIIAVRRRNLTPEQKQRLALFDNRTAELAEWDTDVLAALLNEDAAILDGMWTDDEIGLLLDSLTPVPEPGAGGDDFDTTPDAQQTRVQRGDLWQLGNHRLCCGDSTNAADVARLMGGDRCEMVWTDPPYGVAIGDKNKKLNAIRKSKSIKRNLVNDTLDEPALRALLDAAFAHAARHCLAGGAWYVAAPAGPPHVLFGMALKQLGIWHQTIQWVKNHATFSPLGVDYHWRAEPIFYGWLPGAGHRYYGGRTQDTVWEIDRPVASPDHPTMKPIALVQRAVENSSQRHDLVYDPFLGSGTTLIAAERTGRRCYGMEIDPPYGDVILRRWEAETGQQAVKVIPEQVTDAT